MNETRKVMVHQLTSIFSEITNHSMMSEIFFFINSSHGVVYLLTNFLRFLIIAMMSVSFFLIDSRHNINLIFFLIN